MLFSIMAAPVYIPTNNVGGFPFLLANIWFFVVLMMTILTGVEQYPIEVLIFIFLMISNVEGLFLCLLAICMSSLGKWLFGSYVDFF